MSEPITTILPYKRPLTLTNSTTLADGTKCVEGVVVTFYGLVRVYVRNNETTLFLVFRGNCYSRVFNFALGEGQITDCAVNFGIDIMREPKPKSVTMKEV